MRTFLVLPCFLALGCTTGVGNSDPFATVGQAATFSTSGSGTTGAPDTSETGDELTTGISAGSTGALVDTTGDQGSTGGPPECGNGVLEGNEKCDGEDFGDQSCTSLGFDDGELVCNAGCSAVSTEQCFICGNGTLEGVETCDGAVPEGITCESEGFTEGTIACDVAACQLDTSGCSLCGDGVASGNEQCDDADLGGETCESLGLIGGDLGCDTESCSYVFSGCDSFMEDFESGILGAYWTTGGNAGWIVDSNNPIAGSFSGASGTISHSQQSSLSVTVTYAVDSTISFTHEESTENNFDYLRFYIDGVEEGSWAGLNAPAQASYNVAAGTHTFEWRYTKDGSVNSNQDRVWVDDISTPGGQVQ